MRAYLSPSKLEVYRKFVEGKPDYISQDHVLQAIRGEREWKPSYDLGSGFHLALEKGPERFWCPERGVYVVTGRELAQPQVFTQRQMALVHRYRQRYAGMTHECSLSWADEVGGVPFTVNLRIDGAYGLEVHEHKTTSREFDVEQYERSLQWRIYLQATGGHLCQYNIFQFQQAEPGQEAHIKAEVIRQYPYPGMREEIMSWVQGYLEFVELHQLREYVYR